MKKKRVIKVLSCIAMIIKLLIILFRTFVIRDYKGRLATEPLATFRVTVQPIWSLQVTDM